MSSEVSATRLQLADWVALACAALAPLFYLTAGIDRSVWLDEANSVWIAWQSPSGLLDALSRDGNPPFYYFLLKLSMAFFGDSELAIRMPSFLAYLCGIGAIYRLGLYLFDRHVALLACAFFAMSPVAGRQAQNARMYTLLALLTILSTWIFLKIAWAERRTLQLIVLHGAVAALGLLTHYWFAFVLLGQAAWILGTWSRWRLRDVVLLFVADTLPFTVLWLRTFLLQLHNASASWQQPPRWQALPNAVMMHFWIYPLRTMGVLSALRHYSSDDHSAAWHPGTSPVGKDSLLARGALLRVRGTFCCLLCQAHILCESLHDHWPPLPRHSCRPRNFEVALDCESRATESRLCQLRLDIS